MNAFFRRSGRGPELDPAQPCQDEVEISVMRGGALPGQLAQQAPRHAKAASTTQPCNGLVSGGVAMANALDVNQLEIVPKPFDRSDSESPRES
jgi:hypothetical protein